MDLSKLAPARHATHRARASGQPHLGGRNTAQDGLQSSSQPEDQVGCHTPGPQCSVQVHQCAHQKGNWLPAIQSSRWTPRRRSWWAILRTADALIERKATPRRYACMTSASLNWGVQTPMEFMIWPTTWAG